MRIGLDVVGGDLAPTAAFDGAVAACAARPDIELILYGPEAEVEPLLAALSGQPPANLGLVHCPDIIAMDAHPAQAMRLQPHSSISVGLQHLKAGKLDAFISAGNTGALTVGSVYLLELYPGIHRPCIAGFYPTNDGYSLLLDCGANTDVKPDYLLEFAYLGSAYMREVYHIARPRVALISVGHEPSKGNQIVKQAHALLAQHTDTLNFIGNVEGWDLNRNTADVYVCDGITGNLITKLLESFYPYLKQYAPDNQQLEKINFEYIGGLPLLGVRGNVLIGHGSSTALAFENMVYRAAELSSSELLTRMPSLLEGLASRATS
ncbi:MAG: phosphate acyltransferase [Sphingobacteriia bacterium]